MKSIVTHAVMLVFCVALAAAVFVEALRQHLVASRRNGSAAAEPQLAGSSRQSARLALTMSQRVA